jgi:hypothetical protein
MKETRKELTDFWKLIAYIQEQPQGAIISYEQVQHDTLVIMDTNGRTKLRQAIERAEREYKNIIGQGYVLDSIELVTEIMSIHVQRIYSRVKRTQRAHRILRPKYYQLLPKEERERMDIQGGIIELMAEAGERQKALYAPKRKQIAQTTETIPLP